MILKVDTIENYNNNILIATENMKLGKNNINNKKNMPQPLMEGSKPKVYIPKANQAKIKLIEIKPEVKPEIKTISKIKDLERSSKTNHEMRTKFDKVDEHENMKFILFAVTGGLVGLVLYFYK
jgi:hypothetical protein